MRLAALARGGAGRASLSGGEIRSVRDWELLQDKQASASNRHGALHLFFYRSTCGSIFPLGKRRLQRQTRVIDRVLLLSVVAPRPTLASTYMESSSFTHSPTDGLSLGTSPGLGPPNVLIRPYSVRRVFNPHDVDRTIRHPPGLGHSGRLGRGRRGVCDGQVWLAAELLIVVSLLFRRGLSRTMPELWSTFIRKKSPRANDTSWCFGAPFALPVDWRCSQPVSFKTSILSLFFVAYIRSS